MAINADHNWDVYMSGALSALSKEDYDYVTIQIYDRVQKVCRKVGVKCYLPHKSQTTPNKGMPHSKVWEIDYERAGNSKAIVAYIGMPACGVGAEIEMARRENIPVILIYETSKMGNLPQLMLGNPIINSMIAFDKPADIEVRLEKNLQEIFAIKRSSPMINTKKADSVMPGEEKQNKQRPDTKNIYVCGTLSNIFQEDKKHLGSHSLNLLLIIAEK